MTERWPRLGGVAVVVTIGLLVGLVIGIGLDAIDEANNPPPLPPPRVVEVDDGVWACAQGDLVVPCHFVQSTDIWKDEK